MANADEMKCNADAEQRSDFRPGQKSSPVIRLVEKLDAAAAIPLITSAARLLFVNGQTTERMVVATERLADKLGFRARIRPRWGELGLHLETGGDAHDEIIAVKPAGVDMKKVAATMGVIDTVCEGRMDGATATSELETIAKFPPVALARFALLAAAGAAALGVIFGTTHPLSLVLIALSAGAGACLRRWLAGISHNLFVQPFCAALLAGIIGGIVVRLQLSSVLRLVAVCPCMVLVPGPHFLNGAMDLVRGRIPLGMARITYASLITLVICVGLLLGLAMNGVSLPASGSLHSVPLEYDVLAAGVAVAAYGTFFAMPWRMLPIPIVIGMLAHASRWEAISVAKANPATGAFIACLVVGVIMTPIADRLRLPFAGVAFASVVSLIPGVFLFRMVGGVVDLVTLGSQAPQELFSQVISDGTTASLIIVAMTFGLVIPRIFIEKFTQATSLLRRQA